MSTDITELIGAEVERSFGDEPGPRDPREYAARGRRTLRRRRAGAAVAAVAGASVAAVLVVGGTSHDVPPTRGAEVAGSGSPRTEGMLPVPGRTRLPVDPRQADKCAAGRVGVCDDDVGPDDLHFDRDGRLLRGYEHDEVGHYYDAVLPAAHAKYSAAAELTVHGRTVWALLLVEPDQQATAFQYAPPDPTRSFDEWVEQSVRDGSWFAYDQASDR